MSHKARLLMIDYFISQRDELKAIGRKFLSFAEIEQLSLNDSSVLDHNTYRVTKLLRRDGVTIPASVRATILPTVTDCQPPRCYSSIYHNYQVFQADSSHLLVELLYDKGFRDIDRVSTYGDSPLSINITRSCQPSYALWLIDHGADILRPYPLRDPDNPGRYTYNTTTIAHVALLCIRGHSIIELPLSKVQSYCRLVSLVAPLDLPDECRCGCTEMGCHTMKTFFQVTWEYATRSRRTASKTERPIESRSIPATAEKILTFLRKLRLDLSKWDKVAVLALRYLTFEVLELPHTCCHMPFYQSAWSKDDIVEIEDEYREQLNLLNHLMQDFQLAYSNFECQENQGDKFTSFLTKEWSPMMQQTLAEREAIQLTENEKLKAEELGVRWQSTPEEDGEAENRDIEYWLRKLEAILPDE